MQRILTLSQQEFTIHKYAHPKKVWERVLERDGNVGQP